MLKTFMQPGNSSQSKTDSTRTTPSAYASARTTESSKTPEPAKSETAPTRNEEGSKLIVGPNIKLKGSEITDCEILVVEGRVEASMNSRDIRIAEGGVFSGKAEIDVAEVRGTFEGELTARKRLVVYATGRVNGTIRYGALMVEEGGTITGNMASHSDSPSLVKVAEASTSQPATTESAEEKTTDTEDHSTSVFARSQRRQG